MPQDPSFLADPLRYLGQLSAVKGAAAGAAALLTPILGVVAKEAVTAWMRDRAMRREAVKMACSDDDNPTGEHRRVTREDTAVVALRRINDALQTDADAAREARELALVALNASEIESKRLRERVVELESEHAALRSEIAAKGAALDRVRAENAAMSSRLATTLSQEVEPLRRLVKELRDALNEATGGHAHAIHVPDAIEQPVSQRPTPRSGLHAAVPAVVVPKLPPLPGQIGPDDVTPPARRLPQKG